MSLTDSQPEPVEEVTIQESYTRRRGVFGFKTGRTRQKGIDHDHDTSRSQFSTPVIDLRTNGRDLKSSTAMDELRFDERSFRRFHGTKMDICLVGIGRLSTSVTGIEVEYMWKKICETGRVWLKGSWVVDEAFV